LRLLEEIISNVKAATQNAISLIAKSIPHVAAQGAQPCDCQSALALGIWSDKRMIPSDVRNRLSLLIGKYMG
jgi:5'-methylthioadenosine phosphorylase